jgi:hypothetical protein
MESPDETQLLDVIDAASTWHQVRDAVRAAPPGALTVRAARDAVSQTCRLLRQKDLSAVAATCATSQQGNISAAEGGSREADDGDGGPVRSRTPKEQQWLRELAAMWSEERVRVLRALQAAEVLSSMLEARSDVPPDVVQRLLRRYFGRSARVPAKASVKLLWAACEAAVVLPEEAVAGLLSRAEAGFEQLDTSQLLQLARSLQKLPAQQVPGSLLEVLVARCLHARLDAISDKELSQSLDLVEAVRELSPEASTKLAPRAPLVGRTARVSGGC